MLCGSLDGKGVWGRMNTCVYVAESLHRTPERVTKLLISFEKKVLVTQSCLSL